MKRVCGPPTTCRAVHDAVRVGRPRADHIPGSRCVENFWDGESFPGDMLIGSFADSTLVSLKPNVVEPAGSMFRRNFKSPRELCIWSVISPTQKIICSFVFSPNVLRTIRIFDNIFICVSLK